MFQSKIAKYKESGRSICYIDESGHAFDMPRTHDYAKKGERCFGTQNFGAKDRTNVIGALIGKLLFAVGLFNCNIDSTVFGTWVQEFLLPSLYKSSVIVMDNAAFHKNQTVLNLIRAKGHIIEFLLPYSPDLNPIEHTWAQKKAFIRKYHCSIEKCYV